MAEHMAPDTGEMRETAAYEAHTLTVRGRGTLHHARAVWRLPSGTE